MNRPRAQKRILKPKEPTMARTYRAVQVSKPGRLEVVERELTAPPPGKVRIRVEACGVCHSALTVEGLGPDLRYPRVPDHEVIGRIDALGEGVSAWKLGQRVGVGFLGGYCGRAAARRAAHHVPRFQPRRPVPACRVVLETRKIVPERLIPTVR